MTAQPLPKSVSNHQMREPRPVEVRGLVKRYGPVDRGRLRRPHGCRDVTS
jgi:hypothetical protein